MAELWESDQFRSLLTSLRQLSDNRVADVWPASSLQRLQEAGGCRWNLPESCGGDGVDGTRMLTVYRRLASACLATTFILTQRNAACARIVTSDNTALRARLLTQLAEGRLFATVGISHLTTSRQHLNRPAVAVSTGAAENELVMSGTIPWVTAGTQAGIIVTGGAFDDGRQILAALPTDRAGVDVRVPASLMALSETETGSVGLDDVSVSMSEVLHGPVEHVMQQGAGGGAGSLGTSAVALGAAEGCLERFGEEVERRPNLRTFLDPLQQESQQLVQRLNQLASVAQPDPSDVQSLRHQANSLVIRSAQAWLAATKGAGFMAGHPAERAVRESMFFLVWSCPQNVLEANLREFACSLGDAADAVSS
jgi:alkylation response protein AidB-like acyl-CoA dehydrogenase